MRDEKDQDYQDDEETEDTVVVLTDEEGNELNYREELIIPVNGAQYALLVGIDEDGEERLDENDEEDVLLAKVVSNAHGEVEYVEPTDEEFEAAQAAYDAMMDEDEDEEEDE